MVVTVVLCVDVFESRGGEGMNMRERIYTKELELIKKRTDKTVMEDGDGGGGETEVKEEEKGLIATKSARC